MYVRVVYVPSKFGLPPPELGGSGVGYLMGDLGWVTRLYSLAGYVDDSNPDEVDGAPIGTGRDVVVDLDPGEVGGISTGVARKVVDDSNPDEIVEVSVDVPRKVVGGPNPDEVDGASAGVIWMAV